MRIVVQKFGGTSLSTADARNQAIQHIKHALDQDLKVVVVVSAMGRKGEPYATDTLLEWIKQNGNNLPPKEKDLLLGCGEIISATTLCSLLKEQQIAATVLTGGQAGILTNNRFGDARIIAIHPQAIRKELELGKVVLVTGFQGRTSDGDLTTLGRGGSDTSAAAIGAALKADYVDIFTDVSGVFTADPRIVEAARPLYQVTYSEVCQMAQSGAKVIHPRAVEVAMQSRLPIRVRSTFSDDEGTWIGEPKRSDSSGHRLMDVDVTGIAHTSGVTQIKVFSEQNRFDLHYEVFKSMAEHGISVDFINVNPSGLVYTVYDQEADRAIAVLRELGLDPITVANCAKISIIGGGMNGVPGIMAKIVSSLTALDISILQSADSHSSIWVLVCEKHMKQAVNALHAAFQLDQLLN
jgi:aspartate kinase